MSFIKYENMFYNINQIVRIEEDLMKRCHLYMSAPNGSFKINASMDKLLKAIMDAKKIGVGIIEI